MGSARLESCPHSPDRLSKDPGAGQEGITGPGLESGNEQGVNIHSGRHRQASAPPHEVFHTLVLSRAQEPSLLSHEPMTSLR